MRKEPEWERRTLVCSKALIEDSKELLTFVQLHMYTEAFLRLELTDDEQRAIETAVMMNPILPPVIEGTGGIRELEIGLPHSNPGSLQLTAFYAYFPEVQQVALIDVVETDELGEMTAEERAELRELFDAIQEVGPEAWEQ